MPKVLFLTTAHRFDDDRIFYHQAKSLISNGYDVGISSLSSHFFGNKEGIFISSEYLLSQDSGNKIRFFIDVCRKFQPDCIICSEPLAVFSARKFVGKLKIPIIYDVTEWYPSMRMVAPYRGGLRIFHAIKFFLIQILAGCKSTHFIFGEESKKFPLAYFFPFKKQLVLPYFPDNQYISFSPISLNPTEITLAYTGQPSREKGIEHFLNVANLLQDRHNNLKVNVLIIGSTRSQEDADFFRNVLAKNKCRNIDLLPTIDFEHFTKAFAKAHICFDLREKNFENDHCLPIKIFYYAAAGKPVIYTNLKATGTAVSVEKFGFLVSPAQTLDIVEKIELYFKNPQLYAQHSANARSLYESDYNWGVIRDAFLNFVKDSIDE